MPLAVNAHGVVHRLHNAEDETGTDDNSKRTDHLFSFISFLKEEQRKSVDRFKKKCSLNAKDNAKRGVKATDTQTHL